MHAANSYLYGINKAVKHSQLIATEAQALSQNLLIDAADYYQAAIVSFVDAIRAIQTGFFTWATVKLYYVVFYALRSRLALNGDCVFYISTTPYVINALPGASPIKLSGNSHKAVFLRFRNSVPNDYFLSQDIDGISPLDWLTKRREEANYLDARFCEPTVPSHFVYASRTTTRLLLGAYEANSIYAFDPQHAIVAFPFRMLADLKTKLSTQNINPTIPTEVDFLSKYLRDKNGIIAVASTLLS